MENRCRILEAAAKVYAELGFRGATTRRIAESAGVNEVTLFRTFGSKETLIEEALRHHAMSESRSMRTLPESPVDPERELTAWATAQLEDLRQHRALIRKTMSELEERPDLAPCVTAGWAANDQVLHGYVRGLHAAGFLDQGSTPEEAFAGAGMLLAALFSDAMGREMMPELFPQPAEQAPALYVRLFLRAIACGGAPGASRAPDPDADAGPPSRSVRARAAAARRASSLSIPNDP